MWQEDKGYQMKVNYTHGVYDELLLESKMQNLNVMLRFDSQSGFIFVMITYV